MPARSLPCRRREACAAQSSAFGGYSVKTDVSFRYRGLYEIGVESVDVSDPFRIFRIRKNIHYYSSVRIYPRTLPLDTYEERAASDTPAPFTRAAATPDAAEAANIREYRMGDQLRSVHWKLSAKADDLMVRDFNTNDDIWQHRPRGRRLRMKSRDPVFRSVFSNGAGLMTASKRAAARIPRPTLSAAP